LPPRRHRSTPEYTGEGDVLVTDDWIWAASYDDSVVLRVAR